MFAPFLCKTELYLQIVKVEHTEAGLHDDLCEVRKRHTFILIRDEAGTAFVAIDFAQSKCERFGAHYVTSALAALAIKYEHVAQVTMQLHLGRDLHLILLRLRCLINLLLLL